MSVVLVDFDDVDLCLLVLLVSVGGWEDPVSVDPDVRDELVCDVPVVSDALPDVLVSSVVLPLTGVPVPGDDDCVSLEPSVVCIVEV